MRNLRRVRLFVMGIGFSLLILGLSSVGASSANISHSYHAATGVTNGSLVSLDPQRSDYIELTNTDNDSRLLGVAVANNDSLIAIDPSNSTLQVATSGNVNALVSTLNGDIQVGDQIAASPFSGVGMKALPGSRVIGVAETAFSQTSGNGTVKQVTDKNGQTHQIQLGYVRISIAFGADNTGGTQLNSLQKLAQSLTGRAISTPRVIVSLIVAVVALLALITLIYASIYGSIISIGRNPLAKYALLRILGSVLGMALLTAGIAGLTIFLLLR